MPKGVPRNKSVKQNILHRMKIARGNLDHVITMVEEGSYCIDVIHQSQALQAALKNIDHVLLKNHMEKCVAAEIRKGNTNEVINEVMKIMEKN